MRPPRCCHGSGNGDRPSSSTMRGSTGPDTPTASPARRSRRAGRVIAVVDAYEVMTAARSYKRPTSTLKAREELTAVPAATSTRRWSERSLRSPFRGCSGRRARCHSWCSFLSWVCYATPAPSWPAPADQRSPPRPGSSWSPPAAHPPSLLRGAATHPQLGPSRTCSDSRSSRCQTDDADPINPSSSFDPDLHPRHQRHRTFPTAAVQRSRSRRRQSPPSP